MGTIRLEFDGRKVRWNNISDEMIILIAQSLVGALGEAQEDE